MHSSVRFSKEVEADGQLTYLDVLLTKNEEGIETTIYRKNTLTGLYNIWEILSPIQYKKKCHAKFVTSFLPNLQLIPIDPQRINPVSLAMDTQTGL